MLTPKLAEKIQNQIYQKMPTKKKLKIMGQLFMLGKKLNRASLISKQSKRK